MENNVASFVSEEQIVRARTEFMNKTYAWMVAGLLITGLTAWYVYDSYLFLDILQVPYGMLFLIMAQFGLVFWLNSAISRMSTVTSGMLFTAFSLLRGLALHFQQYLQVILSNLSKIHFIFAPECSPD